MKFTHTKLGRSKPGKPKFSGFTLVELMVGVFVISILFLGVSNSIGYIARSLQMSKATTLATSYAQEKLEILKAEPYYNIFPTMNPFYHSSFTPPIPFDNSQYLPETVGTTNFSFQRLVYIERVLFGDQGTSVIPISPDSFDTGMKRITVTVIWQSENRWQKLSLSSLVINVSTSNSGGFYGTVTEGGSALQGSRISLETNKYAITDSNGKYALAATQGPHTLTAAAAGYFSQSANYTITGGSYIVRDFNLTRMNSGTIAGEVYVNNHLVISQVVAERLVAGSGVEYVELFNPTPVSINVDTTTAFKLKYWDPIASTATTISLVQSTTIVVPAYTYYLIASTPSFLGISANATYNPIGMDIIKKNQAGAIQITNFVNTPYDAVGWSSGSISAPLSEGTAFTLAGGLPLDTALVRMSSPSLISTAYGNAYDSDDNYTNFSTIGSASYPPRNMAVSTLVVAGTPAVGTLITASDGLSSSTTSVTAFKSIGGKLYKYSPFSLSGVATGTWIVKATDYTYYSSISSVTVLVNSTVSIPNAVTIPPWPAPNTRHVILSSSTAVGFVTGRVTNVAGASLGSIAITGGGTPGTLTNSNGYYTLDILPGTYAITANELNGNPLYGSATRLNVLVTQGALTSGEDFVLGPVGSLSGYVCNFSVPNPYPGVLVSAYDSNGVWQGESYTGSNGKFQILNLSTGTYSLSPRLYTGEISTFTLLGTITTLGGDVFVGTLTVSGSYGQVVGNVKKSGELITTGTLVVVTTGTIGTPPSIQVSSMNVNGQNYYMTSSLSNGSYALKVQVSSTSPTTAFNLYGWYGTDQLTQGITVTGGSKTVANLSWP